MGAGRGRAARTLREDSDAGPGQDVRDPDVEEIESILSGHDAVRDVAVLGWPIGAMGEEVAAIVVPEKTIEEAALIEFCKSQLASYKIPRRIFFIEQMPRNEAGKVNKQRLMRALPEQLEGQVKSFE